MHTLVMLALFSPSPLEEWIERVEREQLMEAAKSYWLSMGVMEERETYFSGTWSLESDQDVMEHRLFNTPPDAPPIDAYKRFPDATTCALHMARNRAYQRYLTHRREWLIPGPETAALDAVMEDAKYRLKIWTHLYMLTDTYSGRNGRRYDLHLLREMIGVENFDAGRMVNVLPNAAYRDEWVDPDPGGFFQ